LVYDAKDGKLIHSLKGHKKSVYSVSYSQLKQCKHFASGGADNMVILWNENGKGILKYSHKESVQVVKYNPKYEILASCSNADFGYWTKDKKSVIKHKVDSKIISADWTSDGRILAIGMESGIVSLRDWNGHETNVIVRSDPVWALKSVPSDNDGDCDILMVGCWDRTISFYYLSGIKEREDITVGFFPCCIDYYEKDGGYLIITGSNKEALMCTKHGKKIQALLTREEWIWSIKVDPTSNKIAIGDDGGTLAISEITLAPLYSSYKEKYAFRSNMTDLLIQNVVSGKMTRLKGEQVIEKVSLYQSFLATKTLEEIRIYETSKYNTDGLRYQIRERIEKAPLCEIFSVASKHLIMSKDEYIQVYNFKGNLEHEWKLKSKPTDLIVYGGISGKEAIFVGTESGDIVRLLIDNTFVFDILHHSLGIKSIHVEYTLSKFAYIDNEHNLYVHTLITKELLYKEQNVSSFSFRLDSKESVCFSQNNTLSVKRSKILHQVEPTLIKDKIILYLGKKVYHHDPEYDYIQVHNIRQTLIVEKLQSSGMFQQAYEEACTGIPKTTWNSLGHYAMRALNFEVARKCFIRIREMKFMDIMQETEKMMEQNPSQNNNEKISLILQGSVDAICGEFKKAAKAFVRAGDPHKAIDMYIVLKRWEDAHMIAIGSHIENYQQIIIRKNAEWEENLGNWKEASCLYIKAGTTQKAIDLIGTTKGDGWKDVMITIVRDLSSNDIKMLQLCSTHFKNSSDNKYAEETFIKLNDQVNLIKLYINASNWEKVKQIFITNENAFEKAELMQYAEWLLTQDLFEDAFSIYRKVKYCDQIKRILNAIITNGIQEKRFDDVSYYLWLYAQDFRRDYNEVSSRWCTDFVLSKP